MGPATLAEMFHFRGDGMCGRITQFSDLRLFAVAMGWDSSVAEHVGDLRPRYNVAPQTEVWAFDRLNSQALGRCEAITWGYKPHWARADKTRRVVINARIESVPTSGYYRGLWAARKRVIVPADGWYEWPVIDGVKRPQFISRREGPCFFAGLADVWEEQPAGGMVIITSDADGGLVDVHDRRPVVLDGEDARLWLDPALAPEGAENLLRTGMLAADTFQWWEVGKEVGNVRNQGPQLVVPVQ
ncbi:SOS response-associated peptidase [Cupriavidus nantongensis]|nr:SOS response-associated peptidase [Cupriavidus nantongensis]